MSIKVGPFKNVTAPSALLAFSVLAFFVAFVGSASALPSDRSYEMVSPPDKNGGDVGAGTALGSYFADSDGAHLAYTALGGFADTSAIMTTAGYLATRGDEMWTSKPLALPFVPTSSLLGGFVTSAVSPDFTKVVSATNVDLETGEEVPDVSGSGGLQYVLDLATGDTERLTPPSTDGTSYSLPLAGRIAGDSDFSRIFYDVEGPLTPEAEAVPSGRRLYLWEGGNVTLQSKLPNGDPTNGYLASSGNGTPFDFSSVAANGEVVYFTDSPSFAGGPLYRRDLRSQSPVTDLVNADENSSEVVPLGDAWFIGGSEDGEIAFFNSDQPLVDADVDTERDVYRYDASEPAGSRLTLISVDSEPADSDARVQGLAQSNSVSADGKTVYMSSNSQLVSGEPTTVDPREKLYIWKEGEGIKYIATASLISYGSILSDNDRYLSFISSAPGITGEDNGGFQQVYVYDSSTGDLNCASCFGSGAPNNAAARFRRHAAPVSMFVSILKPRRSVANDGEVFFESVEPLLPQDTNGKYDVYGWKKGRGLELYSTGRSDDNSEFMDASADGDTVFILTREQLSGWDWDLHLDAYAVRVGDGLPEPPDPVPPCTGDDCQGPPPLPPALADPASSQLSGPGNREQSGSADCSKPERKAKRLERKSKRLKRKAKRASGKKAKRLKRKAKAAKRKSKRASRRVARCNAGGDS